MFEYNDGGRAATGRKGTAGDCVTRAIAIAAGLDYEYVYNEMAAGQAGLRRSKRRPKAGIRSARSGVYTRAKWFKDWMTRHGFVWTPTMKIGSGCKVHLDRNELPAGRLVVAVSRHYTTMIDGVVHDTHDPRRLVYWYDENQRTKRIRGTRCVYGYWTFVGPPHFSS